MSRILYLHGFASSPGSSKARFFGQYLQARGADIEIPQLDAGDFEHLTITGQLGVVEGAARGEPVSLIGSSMGGYVAALYASRHPEVERLVLFAPAFGFAQRWQRGPMDVFHYGEGRMRRLSSDLFDDAAKYEDFPDFRQPTLIFHGAKDDVVPVDYSRQFAANHPNVVLEVVDSDHELTDMVDYMAPKVASFLSQPLPYGRGSLWP